VTEAVGAEEALAKAGAEREAFDVLVSDVVLGGLTGDELAVRLCKRWPDLRVVLMSGYTERSLALEPDAFLEKPLTLEELTAAVFRVADYGSKR
jgi:CheY-like chemotaxis protein